MDSNQLSPLTPEVISRQATINIGVIGHVAHGKSTVVKSLSGVSTNRFKSEEDRNMTIKLGYANAKIFECDNHQCPRSERFRSECSSKEDIFSCDRPGCGGQFHLVRHISFIDCPGQDILMATMLRGTPVMDAALLLIAANETCPQPQTSEHLAAIHIMQLKSILVLQSKIDLVKEVQTKEHYQQIIDFVKGITAEDVPIIPISAILKYNIEIICEYIIRKIPVPLRDFTSKPRLIIIRSFDINKPGTRVDDLKGGVAGGSIIKGILKIGQEIEVRPGIVSKDNKGHFQCYPLLSKVVSLYAEQNDLAFAVPGGLIGVGTKIDPILCKADRLVGHVLGEVGTLPEIYTEIQIISFLFRRLVGVRIVGNKKNAKIAKLTKNEMLLLNIGSLCVGGRILAVKDNLAKIQLIRPACAEVSEKIALCRRVDRNFRLIGWGEIQRGTVIKPQVEIPNNTNDY